MNTEEQVPEETTHVELEISGMTCAGCQAAVEKALGKVDGVVDASVNLATEKAKVVHLTGGPQVSDLVEAVKRSGYGASEKMRGADPSSTAQTQAKSVRGGLGLFWLGLAFTLPVFAISMGRDFGLIGEWAQASWVNWLLLALAPLA